MQVVLINKNRLMAYGETSDSVHPGKNLARTFAPTAPQDLLLRFKDGIRFGGTRDDS